jgi:hypothetical protein
MIDVIYLICFFISIFYKLFQKWLENGVQFFHTYTYIHTHTYTHTFVYASYASKIMLHDNYII